ncbi:hypothetical protein [Chryseobacterium bernardetii]|uniref:hypothetical protein n=1 Tax=Chryseobacterium bernardetii TaxID=1241978 RepID=UPI000F4D8408|nr:hypothetical protein [Chryseobacterium bernardetii]AZB33383.1 hypothetical protein EG351_06995 [Chryseobacterium bernardetii]
MITFTSILICLFVVFLINFVIIKSIQNKFPHNTEAENLRLTEKSRQAVLILGLIMIFISIFYINFFHKSEEEILAEKKKKEELNKISAKKIAEENDIKRFGLNKSEVEILNQHEIVIKSLSDEVKNAYSILRSQKYFVDTEIIRFTGLAKKTRGSEFENRVVKTRDSLVKNETVIAQKQITELDEKQSTEESKARLKYGENFRDLLLDKNLDIKVNVFGKDNKR